MMRRNRPQFFGERLEARLCLSSVTFVRGEIACCTWDQDATTHALDLDADGDLDILSRTRNRVTWYENMDGAGAFGEQQETVGANPFQFIADLDGDGDGDLISTQNSVAWHRNIGSGVFVKSVILLRTGYESAYAADVDSDGDLDVLTAIGHRIHWYENTDGEGTFGPQRFVAENVRGAARIDSLSAADLDGDGDLDVISAGSRAGPAAWYENDGVGNFSERREISRDELDSIYVTDLDGDGDSDLLSNSDLGIEWFANDGGTFGEGQMILASAFSAGALAATDFDEDGDKDVLAVVDWDRVVWLDNTNGAGAFSERHVFSTRVLVSSVAAADIDGDGDLDVLTTSSYCCLTPGGEHEIVWHENRLIGDSNDDGVFDSTDLIGVFTAGEYEVASNATFDEGDWNQDGVFDSSDLVFAFQAGTYVGTATLLESQVAAAADVIFATHDDDAHKPSAFVP